MIKRLGKENIIKSILVVLIILSFFVMYKEYKNYQPIESIRVKETKVNKKQFAMYKENDNGEYEVYDNDTFPTNGYKLNLTESYCVDKNETKIDGVLSIDNNKPKVTSDKTLYCYLYYEVELTQTEWVFNYTGGEQTFTVPKYGTYKIELWGAQGGSVNYYGGYGGYVSGKISLKKSSKLYVYTGETGKYEERLMYNGGGAILSNPGAPGATGGGATDIRLINGDWSDETSLKSRIIVASAGGGALTYQNSLSGMHAGGLTGYQGQKIKHSTYDLSLATGGTQTSGGTGGVNGKFGIGGSSTSNYGSGGGSGYYGGGRGWSGNSVMTTGASGSSFISGHTGCVAIESETSLTPRLDSNGVICADGTTDIECSKHYSGYIFTDTLMMDGLGYIWTTSRQGQERMPKPDGTYYNLGEGHSGNGYAKITFIG